MAYTTIEKVRREAGLSGNQYVQDPEIQSAMETAEDYVKSYVSGRYVLASLDNNFTGSQGASVLERITTLLAASFLLQTDYGADSQDTDKDGYKKYEHAMAQLKDISGGTLKLLDSTGVEFTLYGASSQGTISHTMPDIDEYPKHFSVYDKF